MRKFNIVISCLMIAGLIAAAPTFSAAMNEQGASMMKRSKGYFNGGPKSVLTHSINLSYLMHKTVNDEQGKTLGRVADIVVRPDGHAEFVILSRTGVYKTSEKYIPIPWKAFTSHWTNAPKLSEAGPATLSLAQTRIDKAPGFSNINELTNSLTRQKVCKYFKGECTGSMFNKQPAL